MENNIERKHSSFSRLAIRLRLPAGFIAGMMVICHSRTS